MSIKACTAAAQWTLLPVIAARIPTTVNEMAENLSTPAVSLECDLELAQEIYIDQS
jgi:hypothetical protein